MLRLAVILPDFGAGDTSPGPVSRLLPSCPRRLMLSRGADQPEAGPVEDQCMGFQGSCPPSYEDAWRNGSCEGRGP